VWQQIVLVIFVCLIFIGCEQQNRVTISGSSTVLPIVSIAADQFKLNHSDVNVIINGGGSGVGFQQLRIGATDIAMMSRDVSDKERVQIEDDIEVYSIGLDAVVPVVSEQVYRDGVHSITLNALRKIYRGEIDNWKVLGGVDKSILLIDKESGRGTRHIYMQRLFGDAKAKALGADLVLGSNNEAVTAIIQSDRALGMVSYAWAQRGVKPLAIDLGDGNLVLASDQNIKQRDYPFTRDLLLVTKPPLSEVAQRFLAFIQGTSGRQFVAQAGYVAKH